MPLSLCHWEALAALLPLGRLQRICKRHLLLHPALQHDFAFTFSHGHRPVAIFLASYLTLILGPLQMCRVGNKERLYFGDLLRIFLWLYISQTLWCLSDAPLSRNDGRKTLRDFSNHLACGVTVGWQKQSIECNMIEHYLMPTFLTIFPESCEAFPYQK